MAGYRQPKTLLVFDGQSLNIQPTFGTPLPLRCVAGRTQTGTLATTAVAISGQPWYTLTNSKTGRCFRHANSGIDQTILVMNGGTTDVQDNHSSATIYADWLAYAQAARAAGFDKIAACTITPSTVFNAGQNTIRQAVNDLVLINAEGAFDTISDFATDSSLSVPGGAHTGIIWYGIGDMIDPSVTTRYFDGLHWTDGGANSCANALNPALAYLGAV